MEVLGDSYENQTSPSLPLRMYIRHLEHSPDPQAPTTSSKITQPLSIHKSKNTKASVVGANLNREGMVNKLTVTHVCICNVKL